MRLTALRLHNVRRFANRGIAIDNIGDGVNVLSEVNEFGKSTCFDALHALFFQSHNGTPGAVQSLRPYSGGSPLVEADIETSEGRFRLAKQFYGGRHATVTDLTSGRLLAQADEAERFISDLVRGGTAGPAGLLWVRQGNTGLERRAKSEEEGERRAREGVLSSVQGEVEELTGGRRMVEVMSACEEELSRFVTATGRPKAGGAYDSALKERDRLAAEAHRLKDDVQALREALDERRRARERLAELEEPDEAAERRRKVEEAEIVLQSARQSQTDLKSTETEVALLRARLDAAAKELEAWRALLTRAADLTVQHAKALAHRDQALARQRATSDSADAAGRAIDTAEREEAEARELLARLDKAMRAKAAGEQAKELRKTLEQAEASREQIEEIEAALRISAVPEKALRALEDVEAELAGLRVAAAAKAPSVTMRYAEGAGNSVSFDGAPMGEGKAYPVTATMNLRIGALGTLTVTAGHREAMDEELAAVDARRRTLLEQLGVASLAEARQREAAARGKKNDKELARQRLNMLVPDGIDALRDALARADAEIGDDPALEMKGDPDEARASLEAAGRRVADARNAQRELRPAIEQAGTAVVDAEKALVVIAGELDRANETLGPEAERSKREADLADALGKAEAALAPVQQKLEELSQSAPDLSSAEAAMQRARSVVEGAEKQASKLREDIADLTGRISARSDDAVEEAWREAQDALAEAEAAVMRFEREVALLQRLWGALEAARTAARDHYFEPVLRELRPLMGLLFEDAAVVFDDSTLLPQTVRRNGLDEDIERLSGGMREQLAVLTRLAFARLLARDGHPTPVILDDALVYSDDDRIEKMFNALHRQGRDLQIIVFSCRQRAFQNLGGNVLEVSDWRPEV